MTHQIDNGYPLLFPCLPAVHRESFHRPRERRYLGDREYVMHSRHSMPLPSSTARTGNESSSKKASLDRSGQAAGSGRESRACAIQAQARMATVTQHSHEAIEPCLPFALWKSAHLLWPAVPLELAPALRLRCRRLWCTKV